MIPPRTELTRWPIAALASVLLISPLPAEQAGDELEQVRTKVTDMFGTIEREDVGPSEVDGWYKIQRGSIVAYISGDGRYLMQGDLIDLDHEVNLTEASRSDARRALMASVEDNRVISFTPDEVKYSVSVFTDIECTYCRRLHGQIEEYLAHGIEVRYLLYPRNGPASRSWNTSEDVWCSPDRGAALTMAKLDREFASASCDASIIQDHYAIGQQVGLSGTPAIVFEDGELIAGYMPPDALKQRLEQKATAAEATAAAR